MVSPVAVSVVVPAYNVGPYLRPCLDSLRAQSCGSFEVVVVDDGSSDGTGAVADEVAAQDGRFRVLHVEHAGAASARNAGLDAAQGEYVIFCDGDDWCRRDMLAKMLSAAKRHDCDVVLAGMVRHIRSGRPPLTVRPSARLLNKGRPFAGRDFADLIFSEGGANPVNKLWRVPFIRRQGIRFQDLAHVNDLFFVYLALAKAERIVALDDAFYNYRMDRDGSVQNSIRCGLKPNPHPLCWIEAFRAVKTRLAEDGELDAFAFGLLRALLATGVRAMAKLAWPGDIEAYYCELRREWMDLSGRVGAERVRTLDDERAAHATVLSESCAAAPLLAQLARSMQARLALARAGGRLRRIADRLRRIGRWFG